MTQLVLSDALLALLRQAHEPAELRDSSGNIVGYYAPANSGNAPPEARTGSRIDAAELDRRKQPGRKGYTTREVFEHLKSITPDEQTRAYLQQKIDNLPG